MGGGRLAIIPKAGVHAIDFNAAEGMSLAYAWTQQTDGTFLVLHAA